MKFKEMLSKNNEIFFSQEKRRNNSDITLRHAPTSHQGDQQIDTEGVQGQALKEDKDYSHTGKCFSTSSTSFTRDAFGSSKEMATIFQSSSPSSIIAKAANGLTLRTSPILARLSPISTTSTGKENHRKERFIKCEANVKLIWRPCLSKVTDKNARYQDHYPQMLLQHQNLQKSGPPMFEEVTHSSNKCCTWCNK